MNRSDAAYQKAMQQQAAKQRSEYQNAQIASSRASNNANNAAVFTNENIEAMWNRYDGSQNRTAWVLTTKRRQEIYNTSNANNYNFYHDTDIEASAPLVFNVNPNSYQMENPLRQQVVQAKGGPVIHTFRDPARGYTNFGFATMNIEMSSGSLMPRAKYYRRKPSEQEFRMAPGVGNFYKFLELIQEDTVYERDDGSTTSIQPNYQVITMSTLLFPRLTLEGYFINNANWSEQAENPTEVQNWQVAFMIYRTIPSLTRNDIARLYSGWNDRFNNQWNQRMNADNTNLDYL